MDLEAVEMAIRAAMHQAGAAAWGELLQYESPTLDQHTVPCPCGQRAEFKELRCQALLTAVGRVQVRRPYYLCAHCHQGQFPVDRELDVEDTELSPGVRRMLAVVGLCSRAWRSRRRSWPAGAGDSRTSGAGGPRP